MILNIGRDTLHFASSVFHESPSTSRAGTMLISKPLYMAGAGDSFTVIKHDIKSAHLGKNLEF